jgi:hypothetical protein
MLAVQRQSHIGWRDFAVGLHAVNQVSDYDPMDMVQRSQVHMEGS